MSKGPGEGGSETSNDQGGVHDSTGWSEDGISHRESYNTDKDGNITDYHYVQHDGQGTKLVYDYHTGEWIDKSK